MAIMEDAVIQQAINKGEKQGQYGPYTLWSLNINGDWYTYFQGSNKPLMASFIKKCNDSLI